MYRFLFEIEKKKNQNQFFSLLDYNSLLLVVKWSLLVLRFFISILLNAVLLCR